MGDFLDHGRGLNTVGASIVFLLALNEEVESIDVFCPYSDKGSHVKNHHKKIRVIETYRYGDALSVLTLFKIRRINYDRIIFNILPTGFGSTSLPNLFGLLVPITMAAIFRTPGLRVVYHNSVYTNNVALLGYDTFYDRVRSRVLGFIEKAMFKLIDTIVLVELYKKAIDERIGLNRVRYSSGRYLEAIPTLFLNDLLDTVEFQNKRNDDVPTVLLHGFWGPQKNLRAALEALSKISDEGLIFNLIISGGINKHFPLYEKQFMKIIDEFSDIIGSYLGYIDEKKILSLYTKSDLLILPYNTPGGHSGVLEQAIFFEVETVAIDFAEYREQANGLEFVHLCKRDNLQDAIRTVLMYRRNRYRLRIKRKLDEVLDNIDILLQT